MDSNNNGSSASTVLISVVIVIIIGLAFYFGYWARRGAPADQGASVNIEIPAGDSY